MIVRVTHALCALSLLGVFSISAEPAANPYQAISERNAFGLRPPPPVVETPTAPAKPLPELTLTGLADFSFKKWALLISAERGKSPKHLTLSEGESGEGLEVLTIDVEAGTVKVRLEQSEVVLSFKEQEQKQRVAKHEEKKFVDAHTRAHELHQKREAERTARERAQIERQEAWRHAKMIDAGRALDSLTSQPNL
jgi:hypothetical protein